jgi:hypothetical protein
VKYTNESRSQPLAITRGWTDAGVAGRGADPETWIERDNDSGVAIPEGAVVALQDDGTVALAAVGGDANLLGVALDEIEDGDSGPIAFFGPVDQINTTGAVAAGEYAIVGATGEASGVGAPSDGAFALFTEAGVNPPGFLFGGAGAAAAAAAAGSMVPYYLGPGETFTVPVNKQALFADTIEVDAGAVMEIEGELLEVDALTAATASGLYQPLDADLTAIAALTTTPFGRGLLDDADAAAARTTLGLGSLATAASITHAATTGQTANDHHNRDHAGTHGPAAADALKLDDLAAPDDNTDLDASTTKHGLLKKLPGGTTTFLRADGTFAAPPAAAAGTSFPGSPATNDRVFRTDLGMEFYFDGTRWLSSQLFSLNNQLGPFSGSAAYSPMNATMEPAFFLTAPDKMGGSDIWLVRSRITFYVIGGTALSGSHKWVVKFAKVVAGNTNTVFSTHNIDSGSSNAWREDAQAIGALMNNGTTHYSVYVLITKTGTPGDLYPELLLWYRIVAT